jgi:hypothetical protein
MIGLITDAGGRLMASYMMRKAMTTASMIIAWIKEIIGWTKEIC